MHTGCKYNPNPAVSDWLLGDIRAGGGGCLVLFLLVFLLNGIKQRVSWGLYKHRVVFHSLLWEWYCQEMLAL
jgi:hypothetical protein